MRIVTGKEAELAKKYLEIAIETAKQATCARSRCGAVIVSERGCIIGEGFNNPPGGLKSQRRCRYEKNGYHIKVTDRTCCVHAEQRAMIQVLRTHPESIAGSTLYFVRLDEDGKLHYSGAPYCTICSKMALDIGIKYFVLWHKEGITVYDTEEYNDKSYAYTDAYRIISLQTTRP